MKVCCALAPLMMAAACGEPARSDRGPPGGMQFPVEVTSVASERVEYAVTAVGSVEAYERVQVTARVAGVVERVHFREGDRVREGAALGEVEPARYAAAVRSAKAVVARTEAGKAEVEAALARREQAVAQNPGLIPGEELESYRTKLSVNAAAVLEAQAALDLAQLNYRHAYVRAPMAGSMETRSVQTGQYVQPGAVLGTLVRRDPLLLRFKVPETEAARLKSGLVASFKVRAQDGDFQATITHVAETAEVSTRMVAVLAEVDPAQRDLLRPGAFAEVRVPVGSASDAVVIPLLAVRPSERGFVAFVIEGETARERIVELGMRTADGMVEVRSGVAAGETLVVRGAEALRDGARVRIAAGPRSSAPAPQAKGEQAAKPEAAGSPQ